MSSHRLPPAHREALTTVLRASEAVESNWALTGSTSFALRGLDLVPDDIDIQSTRAGVEQFATTLDGDCLEPLSYSKTARQRSWLGTFEVAGVEVDLMGDLETNVEGCWVGPVAIDEVRTKVMWDGWSVPVLSLEYEARAYERIGRKPRARALKRLARE